MNHEISMIDGVHGAACTVHACRLCKKSEDLRFGVCFDCADFVDGKQLPNGTHHLWDRRDPTNEWFARE